jgi:hypothetical protein
MAIGAKPAVVAVSRNNNCIIKINARVSGMCYEPRLGCAREYGPVPDDQKIVSDHEKGAIFVMATSSLI